MKNVYKLAFRNLWRNKRRTIITIASIFFAVFFAIIMRSFQIGIFQNMIKISIDSYSGYLQIQNPDYFNEAIIDNSLIFSDEQIDELNSNKDIKIAVPRIESFSLASYGTQTKGIMIVGIDPILEAGISDPSKQLVKYSINQDVIDKIIDSGLLNEKQINLLNSKNGVLYKSVKELSYDIDLESEYLNDIEVILDDYATIDNNYLSSDDQGILISSQLAKYLNIGIHDTLVLMGQGYYGSTAAGLFPVRGIVKLASPEMDNKLIYMSIPRAQEYFGMEDMYTSIAINLEKPKNMLEVQEALQASLDNDKYIVKNWEEFNVVLQQQILSGEKKGEIFLYIIYFITFFGIFGTLLMMISERKREFGVMMAIGMKKSFIKRILRIEMFLIGIIAVILSIIASSPLIYYFSKYPIQMKGAAAEMYENMGVDSTLPFAFFDTYIIWQSLIVLIMIIVACIFPLRKVQKMKIIESLND